MGILKIHLTCSLCNDRLCGLHTIWTQFRSKYGMYTWQSGALQFIGCDAIAYHFWIQTWIPCKWPLCVWACHNFSHIYIFNSYSFRYRCAGEISLFFVFHLFLLLFFLVCSMFIFVGVVVVFSHHSKNSILWSKEIIIFVVSSLIHI